jgi:hypothetical protein
VHSLIGDRAAVVLANKQDSRLWGTSADLSSGSNSVQPGQADIQENQIGLQFLGFTNRLEPVRALTDNLEIVSFSQFGAEKSTKRLEVIYNEDSDWRDTHEKLLLSTSLNPEHRETVRPLTA